MASINRVTLLGNLGKDPEFKSNDGKKRATFSICTTERYKRADGVIKEETTWLNVVVFGQPAEFVHKYISKGDQAFVEGRIQVRKYVDPQTDQEKFITEVIASNVNLVRKKGDGTTDRTEENFPTENSSDQHSPSSGGSDDLPF